MVQAGAVLSGNGVVAVEIPSSSEVTVLQRWQHVVAGIYNLFAPGIEC